MAALVSQPSATRSTSRPLSFLAWWRVRTATAGSPNSFRAALSLLVRRPRARPPSCCRHVDQAAHSPDCSFLSLSSQGQVRSVRGCLQAALSTPGRALPARVSAAASPSPLLRQRRPRFRAKTFSRQKTLKKHPATGAGLGCGGIAGIVSASRRSSACSAALMATWLPRKGPT